MQVAFRSADEIENEAQLLLDRFALAKDWSPEPPVPIERLINYLGLHQEILDLYSFLGIGREEGGDLLGALSFKERIIYVHKEIDPDNDSRLEGRFNFTLSHEIGHWVLHRAAFTANSEQISLFEGEQPPEIVCRQSDKMQPIEIQANRFASCLLLPRSLVIGFWRSKIGSTDTMTPELRRRAIRQVASRFLASKEATQYRLEALNLLAPQHQQELRI